MAIQTANINTQTPELLSWHVAVRFQGESSPRQYTMTGKSQGSAMLHLVCLLMDADVPSVADVGFTRQGGAA